MKKRGTDNMIHYDKHGFGAETERRSKIIRGTKIPELQSAVREAEEITSKSKVSLSRKIAELEKKLNEPVSPPFYAACINEIDSAIAIRKAKFQQAKKFGDVSLKKYRKKALKGMIGLGISAMDKRQR